MENSQFILEASSEEIVSNNLFIEAYLGREAGRNSNRDE
jgi:ABC-type branched-subunit amino acid transport system ATPase component